MKFWKIFLLVTVPYAVLMMLFKLVSGKFGVAELSSVLIGSFFFGVLFTLFITWFTKWQMKKILIELKPDEKSFKEAGANRMLNLEGVGGKLVLTDRRLIFKSHKINIQVHQFDVALEEIQSVEAGKTGGFLKNVLMVYLKDGSSNKFIVFEPDEWAGEITSRLTSAAAR